MPGLPLEAPSGQGSAPTASRGTKPWRDYSFNVVAGPFQTVCLLYTSFAKGELPHGYCISSGGDKVHTNDQWVCKYISSRHGSNHAATLHLKVDIGKNARKQCQVDCYLLGNEKCLIIKNCTIRVRSTQSTQSSPLRLCYHSCEESRRKAFSTTVLSPTSPYPQQGDKFSFNSLCLDTDLSRKGRVTDPGGDVLLFCIEIILLCYRCQRATWDDNEKYWQYIYFREQSRRDSSWGIMWAECFLKGHCTWSTAFFPTLLS